MHRVYFENITAKRAPLDLPPPSLARQDWRRPWRLNILIPDFAFSSLPRFIRDESSGAPSIPKSVIHALGRVKLRQASGVLFMGNMAGNLSSKVPPPLFSGNTPPLPGIAQIKSRHGPRRGYPCCCRVAVGNIARPASQRPKLPQILHRRGKTTHPIIHRGTNIRARARGERQSLDCQRSLHVAS